MQQYFTNKAIKDTHYEGLKADQAQALYKIAESGKDGMTDAQLAQFNEAGEPIQEGQKPLKVKTALLRKGLLICENIASERTGVERTYEATGVALTDDLSASLKRVGGAIVALGSGTKTQVAERLAAEDVTNFQGELTDEVREEILKKARKSVDGVWLRLQDRGIIRAVKKSETNPAGAGEAPTSDAAAVAE